MNVVWTRKARRGIDDLHSHIAKDSPIDAERFVERILDAVAMLADTPRIGKRLPEADREHVRQRIVQSQRVIYAIDDERQSVTILALVHVRQDLAAREDKPWK